MAFGEGTGRLLLSLSRKFVLFPYRQNIISSRQEDGRNRGVGGHLSEIKDTMARTSSRGVAGAGAGLLAETVMNAWSQRQGAEGQRDPVPVCVCGQGQKSLPPGTTPA